MEPIKLDWSNEKAKNYYDYMQVGNVTADGLNTLYSDWATTYDEWHDNMGYLSPQAGARKMSELMTNKEGTILDVACGTGLSGQQLHQHGFKHIVGVDISEKSTEVAKEKGVYQELHVADVEGSGLPYSDNTFDGLVCISAFVQGHLGLGCFPELARVVKPGGYIVLSVRERWILTADWFKDGQFDAAIAKLSQDMKWTWICRDRDMYIGDDQAIIYGLKVM